MGVSCCLNSETDPAGHDVEFPLNTLVYNCALPSQRMEDYYSKPAYYSLLSHLPPPHTSTTPSHFSQESCWADEHGSDFDLHCLSTQQIQHLEKFPAPDCSKTSLCPLGMGRRRQMAVLVCVVTGFRMKKPTRPGMSPKARQLVSRW